MDEITIEAVGGFAGMGGPAARIRSAGRLRVADLSPGDRAKVDRLFDGPATVDANMKYRLTRQIGNERKTVEARPEDVPQALIASIQDELN